MANVITTNNNNSDSNILTVIVLDSKSQPASGMHVSITPSDASGLTNSAGEIQFKLGSATKYDVTASAGLNTVTVPYYVAKGGATRLVINPGYVKSVEQKLHQSALVNSYLLPGLYIVLGIIVIYFVVRKLFFRSKK
jgi:hypothetical protein